MICPYILRKKSRDLSILSTWEHLGEGHEYKVSIIDATCSNEGYRLHKCIICGEEFKDQFVDKVDHSYGEWMIDVDATCLEEGSMHHTCLVCGHVETSIMPIADHDYQEEVVKEATCTDNGEVRYTCTVCSHEHHEYTSMLNHNYQKKVVSNRIELMAQRIEELENELCSYKH